MKFNQFFRFIQAIMFAFVSIPMIAQIGVAISPGEFPVSQTEAFSVLKTRFLDREVDYYLMDGYSANDWPFLPHPAKTAA